MPAVPGRLIYAGVYEPKVRSNTIPAGFTLICVFDNARVTSPVCGAVGPTGRFFCPEGKRFPADRQCAPVFQRERRGAFHLVCAPDVAGFDVFDSGKDTRRTRPAFGWVPHPGIKPGCRIASLPGNRPANRYPLPGQTPALPLPGAARGLFPGGPPDTQAIRTGENGRQRYNPAFPSCRTNATKKKAGCPA